MVVQYDFAKIFFPEYFMRNPPFVEESGSVFGNELVFTWEGYQVKAYLNDCNLPRELLVDPRAVPPVKERIIEPTKELVLGDLEPARGSLKRLENMLVYPTDHDFSPVLTLSFRRNANLSEFELLDGMLSTPFEAVARVRTLPRSAFREEDFHQVLSELAGYTSLDENNVAYVRASSLQQAMDIAVQIYELAPRIKDDIHLCGMVTAVR